MFRRNMWVKEKGMRRSCSIILARIRCRISKNIQCFEVFVGIVCVCVCVLVLRMEGTREDDPFHLF